MHPHDHPGRAIIIIDGSTGATVIGNTTTTGGHPTVDIDDSSRPGSRREANNPA